MVKTNYDSLCFAYLWIPSLAQPGIRGLIMAPRISLEGQFIRNPEIENAAWFKGSINNVPVMEVRGEFEEYDNSMEGEATDHSSVVLRKDVLRYRSDSPLHNLFLPQSFRARGSWCGQSRVSESSLNSLKKQPGSVFRRKVLFQPVR